MARKAERGRKRRFERFKHLCRAERAEERVVFLRQGIMNVLEDHKTEYTDAVLIEELRRYVAVLEEDA